MSSGDVIKSSLPLEDFLFLFRPDIQKFNGIKKPVTIENWTRHFESTAKRYHWTKDDLMDLLGEYLEDEALNFYLNEKDSTSSWNEMKIKLIERFKSYTLEPIIEFTRLKFHHCKNVMDYFESKRRLAHLAGISESDAVPLMIEHLGEPFKQYFTDGRTKTYDQFATIVQSAESLLPPRIHGDLVITIKGNFSSVNDQDH